MIFFLISVAAFLVLIIFELGKVGWKALIAKLNIKFTTDKRIVKICLLLIGILIIVAIIIPGMIVYMRSGKLG
jgi:hypothetical protein